MKSKASVLSRLNSMRLLESMQEGSEKQLTASRIDELEWVLNLKKDKGIPFEGEHDISGFKCLKALPAQIKHKLIEVGAIKKISGGTWYIVGIWDYYRKKIGKGRAIKRWVELDPIEQAMCYISAHETFSQEYRQHLCNFIDDKAWENQYERGPKDTPYADRF